MKKIFNIYTILLTSAVVFAASTSDFIFRIGPKGDTTTERQLILTDDNILRVPSGGGDIEFTNDAGASFKKIGSGSGGGSGINVLADFNADFESGNPPASWTASGGTFVADTATPLFGLQSGQWDPDGNGQTLKSVAAPIERGFLGQTCQMTLKYRWPTGVAGEIQLKSIYNDGGDSEKTVQDLLPTSGSDVATASINMDCPSTDTTTMQISLEATVADPAPITIDNAFIGTGNNVFQLSQTELAVFARYEGTASCTWSVTSAAFTDLGSNASCPPITVDSTIFDIDVTDDDLPTLVINNLSPNKYVLKATFYVAHSVAAAITSVRFIDDSNGISGECAVTNATNTELEMVECSSTFTTTETAAKTFRLQGLSNSGAVTVLNDATGRQLTWELIKYPLSSAEALTLETSGFLIKATFDPSSDLSLGTSTVGSFQGLADAGAQLIVQTGEAKVPCNAAAATGTTCSGSDEVLGINFNAPTGGDYEICFSSTHSISIDPSGDMRATFRIDKITNGTNTIEESGFILANNRLARAASGSSEQSRHFNLCDVYRLDAGEHTFHINRTQTASGTVNLNYLVDTTLSFLVRNVTEQKPTPVFTDLQDSLESKVETPDPNNTFVLVGANISCDATPQINSENGNWLDSVSYGGAGLCTLNFSPGVLSSDPNDVQCVCTQTTATSSVTCRIASATATSQTVQLLNSAAAATDGVFEILCHAAKQ